MTLQIVALIVVVVAFSTLLFLVYAPSNKRRFETLGRIPLDDAPASTDSQAGSENS